MKKIANVLFYVLVVLIIGYIILSITSKKGFYVIQTNYEDDMSVISYYENSDIVSTDVFEVGSIKRSIESSGYYFLGEESYQLMELENTDINTHDFNKNIAYIESLNGTNYVLSANGFNLSKLDIYNSTFDVHIDSIDLKGFPINFTIVNQYLYILVNEYNDDFTKNAVIYSFSIDTQEVIKLKDVKEITFGFKITNFNNVISIYGNKEEESKTLSVYSYNINSKDETITHYPERVMWISEIVNENDCTYILSENLIVKIENNEIVKVIRTEYQFIDFEFNHKEKAFYILGADYINSYYVVQVVDLDFNKLDEIDISAEGYLPLKVVVK